MNKIQYLNNLAEAFDKEVVDMAIDLSRHYSPKEIVPRLKAKFGKSPAESTIKGWVARGRWSASKDPGKRFEEILAAAKSNASSARGMFRDEMANRFTKGELQKLHLSFTGTRAPSKSKAILGLYNMIDVQELNAARRNIILGGQSPKPRKSKVDKRTPLEILQDKEKAFIKQIEFLKGMSASDALGTNRGGQLFRYEGWLKDVRQQMKILGGDKKVSIDDKQMEKPLKKMEIKPRGAKKIIKAALEERGLSFEKLTARTASFSDLARGNCVFVKIHGWKPDSRWNELKELAKDNGFCLES